MLPSFNLKQLISFQTIITIIISFIIFYKLFQSIPLDSNNNQPQILPLFIIAGTFVWTTQFALSCQHFIVSGSVLRWYFNRDKTKIQEPIKSSLFHLIRFHLGSACLGSLLIVLGKLFRIVLFPFRVSIGFGVDDQTFLKFSWLLSLKLT